MPRSGNRGDYSPRELAEDRPAFHRQPKETPPAWEAFQMYRDMRAERSQLKVAARLEKSTKLIARWSTAWRWVDRAEAFDLHEDSIRRKVAEKELAEAAKRQVKEAQVAIGALLQPSRALLEKMQQEPDFLHNISAYDLSRLVGYNSRLLDKLFEAERIARGQPGRTDRQEVTGAGGGPVATKGEVHVYVPDNGRGGGGS